MRPEHPSSGPFDRALVVRDASQALRLARSGSGPILALLSDWDAVDALRAVAVGAGLESRLAVHHRSATQLAGIGSLEASERNVARCCLVCTRRDHCKNHQSN